MAKITIIPQAWVDEGYKPLPSDWWVKNSTEGLRRAIPNIEALVDDIAKAVNINPRLLVTRMQLEQGALTYGWDGSSTIYDPNGKKSDWYKTEWLCGVDKPRSEPEGGRKGAWRGPERQLLGCALRFKYWYRGQNGPKPEWKNVWGLSEDARYQTGKLVTRKGITLVPENQASADCLRYTFSMPGQKKLAEIGREYFPSDYQDGDKKEDTNMPTFKKLKIVLDPGHGTRGDLTGTAGGGLTEQEVNLAIGLALRDLLKDIGHNVIMTRTQYEPTITKSVRWRGEFSARQRADVFLSIHHDGSSNRSARGTHGFYHNHLAPKGKALATALAKEVNDEFGVPFSYGGPSSDWFGKSLGVLSGGRNWAVTDAAALIEMMFMSNSSDLGIIKSNGYVERAAKALARAIHKYAGLPVPKLIGGTDEMPDENPGDHTEAPSEEVVVAKPPIEETNLKFRRGHVRRSRTDKIFVHNSASTGENDDAYLFHKWHLQRDGGTWNGLGYHFVIKKDGTIQTGRPHWASGAHVLPEWVNGNKIQWNYRSIGICLAGSFDKEEPRQSQIDSLIHLISWLITDPDLGYDHITVEKIVGHRDHQKTTGCPSKNMYSKLPAIRKAVDEMITPQIEEPAPPESEKPEDPQDDWGNPGEEKPEDVVEPEKPEEQKDPDDNSYEEPKKDMSNIFAKILSWLKSLFG